MDRWRSQQRKSTSSRQHCSERVAIFPRDVFCCNAVPAKGNGSDNWWFWASTVNCDDSTGYKLPQCQRDQICVSAQRSAICKSIDRSADTKHQYGKGRGRRRAPHSPIQRREDCRQSSVESKAKQTQKAFGTCMADGCWPVVRSRRLSFGGAPPSKLW